MILGNINLDQRSAGLAPMAGVADMAFRELCREFGATYVVGEMVSSKGLTMGDRKSKQLLELSERERPAAVQLFGCEGETMARAAVQCLEFKPQVIDINMGCPAPKIWGNGGGSALMKDPVLAEKIIKAVVNAVNVPVTVKIRTGWDSESRNAVEIAKRAENVGAAAVTVHGRTKAQMYAPPIDFETIAEVKRSVSIPVIANGDIVDGASAARMIEKTNCDYLLVGRGALGRPWVFSQITAYLNHEVILPEPPVSERMRIMIKHIARICEYKGERTGILQARKHAAWYMKGIKGAAELRQRASVISSIEELSEIAFEITKSNQ